MGAANDFVNVMRGASSDFRDGLSLYEQMADRRRRQEEEKEAKAAALAKEQEREAEAKRNAEKAETNWNAFRQGLKPVKKTREVPAISPIEGYPYQNEGITETEEYEEKPKLSADFLQNLGMEHGVTQDPRFKDYYKAMVEDGKMLDKMRSFEEMMKWRNKNANTAETKAGTSQHNADTAAARQKEQERHNQEMEKIRKIANGIAQQRTNIQKAIANSKLGNQQAQTNLQARLEQATKEANDAIEKIESLDIGFMPEKDKEALMSSAKTDLNRANAKISKIKDEIAGKQPASAPASGASASDPMGIL